MFCLGDEKKGVKRISTELRMPYERPDFLLMPSNIDEVKSRIKDKWFSDSLKPSMVNSMYVNDLESTYLVERPMPIQIAKNIDAYERSRKIFSSEVVSLPGNNKPRERRFEITSFGEIYLDNHRSESSESLHRFSGYLSSSSEAETEKKEEKKKDEYGHNSDDSATERDERHVGSSQTTKSAMATFTTREDPHGLARRPEKTQEAQKNPVRALSGKVCVIAPTNGDYQPLYHQWKEAKDVPKIHLFYFDGYTYSPFDTPPVNIPKYFAEKEAAQERKSNKRRKEMDQVFCEHCKAKLKDHKGHRNGQRHQSKVDEWERDGHWDPLDRLSEELFKRYYDSL